mmetsp:Transcript_75233/g.196137  ORF Transcript_75233/g.196137 Transcript_75233/m.196137 type:complete len:205 (+) Transcript_75233:436-1050(+)
MTPSVALIAVLVGGDADGDFYNCNGVQGQHVRVTRNPNLFNKSHFCRMKVFGLAATTATTTATPAAASATGDPHLQNIYGERFNLMKPGKVVLVQIPRGKPGNRALLTVEADARQLGGSCADMYFQTVNVTGEWAEELRASGFIFTTQGARDDEAVRRPIWMNMGPLKLKVVAGRTREGIRHLNFYRRAPRPRGCTCRRVTRGG